MKIEKTKLKVHIRQMLHSRETAIRSIYEAIVELLTNPGDSYNRLFRNKKRAQQFGPILIEYYRSLKNPYLRIYDQAEGMSHQKLLKSFSMYRERTSEVGDRGFMGYGASDCTALCDLFVQTIKDDEFSQLKLKQNTEIEHGSTKVTSKHRKELKLKRGDGTVATLYINPKRQKIKLPQIDKLIELLPQHFAVNSLLNEKSEGAKVNLRDANKKTTLHLVYREPSSLETVVNLDFIVNGYPNAKAKFVLKKSKKPLPEYNKPFNQHGIIVKSGIACHERSFLDEKYKDEQLLLSYIGELECDYINQLAEEFDQATSSNKPIPENNPELIIDENRLAGLSRNHPFTKALFEKPLMEIKKILDKEREKFRQSKDIGSKETEKTLKKAAKIFDDFLKEESDIDESLHGGDQDKLKKKGIILFPPYLKMQVGEEKYVSMYINREKLNVDHEYIYLKMSKNEECLEFEKDKIHLVPTKKNENVLKCRFLIKAISPFKNGEIKIFGKNNQLTTLPVTEVYEILNREFEKNLEFEHKNYNVLINKKRTIKVFAKVPEFIDADTESKISNSNHENVAHLGRSFPLFKIKKGSNFALAEITVQGRRLNSDSKITIDLNELNDTCKVNVVEKEESKGIEIKIVEEDFRKYRAIWDRETPHLLKISALHPQLKGILGSRLSSGHFQGETTTHFKVLLCEILAERLAWKKIELSTRKEPGLYTEWRDEKDVRNIGDSVVQIYLKFRNDAILKLFETIVSKSELKIDKENNSNNVVSLIKN